MTSCRFFFFIALSSLSFISLHGLQYPPMTQEETANYQKQIEESIHNAEKALESAKYGATRRDVAPTSISKVALQNAIIQLEVKKTLVNNFRGTESLESPLVRRKLLDVLNKSMITPSDLADLQTLVIQEKAKIRDEKARNTPPPAPAPVEHSPQAEVFTR